METPSNQGEATETLANPSKAHCAASPFVPEEGGKRTLARWAVAEQSPFSLPL